MKTKSILILLVFAVSAMALSSCVLPRFVSAADMFAIKGTINKTDGSKLAGYLTNTSTDVGSNGIFFCYHQSKKASDYELVSFNTIKNVEINSTIYEPRLLQISETGDNKFVMLKRLSPITYTKMSLYLLEYDESDKTVNGQPANIISKYYIQLPGDGPNSPVYFIEGPKLLPTFETKMSALVADCPVLAKKIQDKEDGYHFPAMLTGNKEFTVLTRIIDEYNHCK